jgi:Uncharacterized protein conserved in bacteria
MTRQELQRLVENNGFENCWPEIEIWLQREILLTPDESKFDDSPIGGTKQGGEPDLPPGLAWPKYKRRNVPGQHNTSKPMSFLLQLRCADIKPFAPDVFPDYGLLLFFAAIEHNALVRDENDVPIGCVLHVGGSLACVDEAICAELVRTPFPKGLYFGNHMPPNSLKIAPSQTIGFEAFNEAIERKLGYSAETSEKIWEFYCREIVPAGRHKMFASPSMFELDIAEECRLLAQQNDRDANADWHLLLEYDLADLPIEENGRLYYMVSRDALAAGRFGEVYILHDEVL